MNTVSLILAAIIVSAAFATIGVWFGRRVARSRSAEQHQEVLLALFQTGGTLHAVFLAFLVVVVWQFYDAARVNVAEEASALATLYRTSAGMDTDAGQELRRLLRNYTEAVILQEWPIQAETAAPVRRLGL